MRHRLAFSTSFWIALFGLLLVASTTLRAQPDGGDRPLDKRHVVIVDSDGNKRVWDGAPNIKRGYLGVGLTDLSPELRVHFGAPENAGVMVAHVEPGSPAEKAGLAVGDIILAVDGKQTESSLDLREHLRDLDEGTLVAVEVRRGKETKTLKASVEKRQHAEVDMAPLFRKRMVDDGDIVLDMARDRSMPMVMPLPRLGREGDLEKKLKELEKRIKELEAKLPKQ